MTPAHEFKYARKCIQKIERAARTRNWVENQEEERFLETAARILQRASSASWTSSLMFVLLHLSRRTSAGIQLILISDRISRVCISVQLGLCLHCEVSFRVVVCDGGCRKILHRHFVSHAGHDSQRPMYVLGTGGGEEICGNEAITAWAATGETMCCIVPSIGWITSVRWRCRIAKNVLKNT